MIKRFKCLLNSLLLDYKLVAAGFEPTKRIADDLKSPSFDRTWIHYLFARLVGKTQNVCGSS